MNNIFLKTAKKNDKTINFSFVHILSIFTMKNLK